MRGDYVNIKSLYVCSPSLLTYLIGDDDDDDDGVDDGVVLISARCVILISAAILLPVVTRW